MSQCHRFASVPATAPDRPTKPIWPRLTCPAQPVSTTSDRPMIA